MTQAQLAERFDVHPKQITLCKAEFLKRAAVVFSTAGGEREAGPYFKASITENPFRLP